MTCGLTSTDARMTTPSRTRSGASLFQAFTVNHSTIAARSCPQRQTRPVREQACHRAQRVTHVRFRFQPVGVDHHHRNRGRKPGEHRRAEHQPDRGRLRDDRRHRASEHPPFATRQHDRDERNAELRLERQQAECNAGQEGASSLEREPSQPECNEDKDGDLAVENRDCRTAGTPLPRRERARRSDDCPATRRHVLHTIAA